MKAQWLEKNSFESWILEFTGIYGQDAPDNEMIVLPKIWSKTTIHKIYQEESPDPKVNKKYFFTLFRKTVGARRIDKSLPHIRISKYSTHSKCNVCVDLMKERERIKTEEDKDG